MTRPNAFRFALVLAAGLLLAGCAAITKLAYSNATLAYSNLAPMAAWMVDDYTDLSGSQKDWVRSRLSKVMQWHRAHELPQYRKFLEHVLQEASEPFSVQEIGDAYADLRDHYHHMVEYLLPDVADFLLQLDVEQVAQMEKKFDDDNKKFVRESLKGTPADRVERRADKLLNHFESWLGSVTPEQRAIVMRRLAEMPDFVEERLADRKYRQGETLRLIRSKAPKDQVVAGLHRLLVDTETWRRPEFRKQMELRDRKMFELLAAVSATLSPAQRAYLQERIRRYLADIGKLTGS